MTLAGADPRPFTGATVAALVLATLPEDDPEADALAALSTLLVRELPELEAEVGCRVVPRPGLVPGEPAVLIGPARANAALAAWREGRTGLPPGPYVAIDRPGGRIVVDAPAVSGIGEAIQLLRTAVAEHRELLTPSICATAQGVLDRLDTEVRRTFPLLAERAPAWEGAVARARAAIDGPDDPGTLQRLMATLNDAHSWARDSRVTGRLPYHLHDDGATARFWSVPEGTAAWEHGVRPGDIALAPDTAPWRQRTGSAPHARPWNVGYRALQAPIGATVTVAGRRADGSEARWQEIVTPLPWREPITAGRLDARTGYVRIWGWLNAPAWHDALEAALRDLAPCERLVVDLRGNVGGALVAAQDARARFLTGRTEVGMIRFTTVTGALDPPRPIVAEPADGPRWEKPVRFLTDPLTYSASEDFLHGLQGLPHVQLVGQATGGGSGRPRSVALRPGIVATISTALTYDRAGRCIEGNGFAPDIPIPADPTDPDASLRHATSGW